MKAVLANTGELVEQCLREVAESRLVFYDTETSGLDERRNHVVGYVLKAHQSPNSYYVPVRHHGGGNLPGCRVPETPEGWRGDLHPFEVEFAKVARSNGHRRWVGHYLDFDMKMSDRHGIHLEGDLEDTMLNAALIDENQRSFSLDAVAKYMEVTAKKGDELYEYIIDTLGLPDAIRAQPRKSMEHFWRTNAAEPVVYEYAAGDDITTEELWAEQQKVLDEEDLRRVHGIECRLIRTIFRMTRRGVRIDEDQLDVVSRKFQQLIEDRKRSFPPGFKSNAPTQMKAFLAHRIDENWPRNPVTKAQRIKAEKDGTDPVGALKFDEKTLMKVPEGRDIVLVRKMEHAESSFTGPMKNEHLFNGRVHCSFNQMKKDDYGTVTGRLSSSRPNLQQVPKRDKIIGPLYRTIFLPEEGHYWDTNDYKQQEYVVFADYTRDPALVAGYSQDPPVDIHSVVAEMFGVERDPTAKRLNLGILYGMGKDALAGHVGCSVAEAIAYKRRYQEKFPSGPGFLDKAGKRAKARGWVKTYLGRRRRFTPEFAHKAGNAVIQGSSADITKTKMVEVDEFFASEGDLAFLMLQVHDALDLSIPIGMDWLGNEARRIMKSFGENDVIKMGVPLGVDSGQGPNWSVATYGAETVAKALAL